MSVEFSLVIGYKRRRGITLDQWESRVSSLGLMIIGAVISLIILLVLVPHILSLF